LALALNDWQGLDKVLVNLEGHGREEIIQGVDISRTIGWFTSLFPVLLEVDKKQSLSYAIKSIKEALRRIPNKGIGYGILKYVTPNTLKNGVNLEIVPEISFNYLGQFGQESKDSFFDVSPFKTGPMIHPQMERQNAIEINGLMAGDTLNLSITFNPLEFDETNIRTLAQGLKEHLIQVIVHCTSKKDQEYTPSDFGCRDLSIPHLEAITRHVQQNTGNRHAIDKIYPLTPMQAGMIYHSINDIVHDAYFEQGILTLSGEIDHFKLEKSFNYLINRHDIFRTLFVYEGLKIPLQVVLKQRDATIDYVEIDDLEPDEQNQFLERYKKESKQKGFDLTAHIPTAISLFKLDQTTYKLLWSFHHILMDGWCIGIVFKELFQAYIHFINETPIQLAPVTPYKDYIDWLATQDKEQGLQYWQDYLGGYRQTVSLIENLPGEEDGYKLEIFSTDLSEQMTSELNKIANINQVTLNTLFQVFWAILLYKYTEIDDIVFGVVVSGRIPEVNGIDDMVGLFINTLPFRINIQNNQSFAQLVRHVQKKEILSKSYEYVPLPEILSNNVLKGDLFHQIMVFENYPLQEVTNDMGSPGDNKHKGFKLENFEFDEQGNYDFNILIGPGKCLSIKFNYNSFKYDKDFIDALIAHFREIIENVVQDPEILIADINMMTRDEKAEILMTSNFNNEDEEYDF
jgi:non-ribosomal peptide synthase protein (TIGR01720 family)